MEYIYDNLGGLGDFTVTSVNTSGTIYTFTIVDACKKVNTSVKLSRAILGDAIDQFIATNRAALNTNGDSDVKGSDDWPEPGNGFKNVTWEFGGSDGSGPAVATMELTATTSITAGDITVSVPYADVL